MKKELQKTVRFTLADVGRLAECEEIIERGLTTFIEVGSALLKIRDEKLYRKNFTTFEEYCRERWKMSKTHANRLVQSADVMANLTPTGVIPMPTSERQTRPLAGLPASQQQAAWTAAVAEAGGKQPTARQVEAKVTVLATPHPPAPARPVFKRDVQREAFFGLKHQWERATQGTRRMFLAWIGEKRARFKY